ncbi:MAG: thiamine phosphate synthase [Pseudomonadota bacterium]
MVLNIEALKLYLVTDRALCAELGVVETVRRAVAGGVTCVQLRDKQASTADLIDLGKAIKATLAGTGVPLIINDDLEAAHACGADGVHVGQSDTSAEEARAALGSGKTVGLSCETMAHVRAVDPDVVDYLGLGPVFATATKGDHAAPIGLDGLREMCAATPLPTVAIGGLKAKHFQPALGAGADGIAVVSAICGQPDPEAAARAILQPS